MVDWVNDVEARTEARRARTAATRAEIVGLPGRLRAKEARRAELVAQSADACTGDPCICANGIGCVTVPVEEW